MRTYWYWPFLPHDELGVATAFGRLAPGLLVHTLAGERTPESVEGDGFRVVADLPDVDASARERSPRWLASRATTYASRVTSRRRLVREHRPDLAHVMFVNHFTDWADLDQLRRRVPLVTSVHDVVPHEARLPGGLQRRVLARLYHHAGHLVATHEQVERGLVEDFGVPDDRVSVVPLAVRTAEPPPVRELPVEEPVHLLFFGTLRRNKGLHVLLEAMARLPEEKRLCLHVAGRGFAEVEALVRDACAGDARITCEIGWTTPERKAELFRQASLVVLPYTSFASQSGVLHDAYAYGLPVVASDVGALGPDVEAEGTGWTVPPSDPDALAAALARAVTDADGYRARAAASRAVALRRTPAATAESLLGVYERVLGGGAAGR